MSRFVLCALSPVVVHVSVQTLDVGQAATVIAKRSERFGPFWDLGMQSAKGFVY